MSKQKPQTEEKQATPSVNTIPDVDIHAAATALEEAVMDLIFDEPFYANLTLNMRREFTTKFPTLAVNVTDEVNLYINPYFFCNLTRIERVAVLKHECLHVVNNHFVRFRDLEPQIYDETKERSLGERLDDMTQASVLNQAADYAINEFLPTLPREVDIFDKNGKKYIHPDKLEDGSPNPDAGKSAKGKLLFVKELQKKFPNIHHEQNLEYYYEFLKQEQEKQKQNGQGKGQGSGKPQPGSGGMTLDDHSAWHESDASEDQITDKVKEIVNKAVEQTGDRAMGNMPGSLLQAIGQLNHVPKDWRQDIQRFVARTAEILIESSRKKRNRRYGILYPGYITYPKMHLVNIIDSSGSVNDEECAQFFSEMARIHKMEIKLTVIEHDHKVQAIYDFDPKQPYKLNGRGGTSFKEAFEKAMEMDIDGIIHFTDGECYDEGIKRPKVPVLAALTGGKNRPYPYKWASKTFVEVKKRVRR